MTSPPLNRLSVIIATYRGDDLVRRCLDSMATASGGRLPETIDLVKKAGGRVAGVVLLVDRSAGRAKFGRIPMFSLMKMTPETWTAAECPMCRAGGHPVHPGS